MIPAFIIWCIKKGLPAFRSSAFYSRLKSARFNTPGKQRTLSVLMVLCAASHAGLGQQSQNMYTVIYKGENVGTVLLKQQIHKGTMRYQIISDVKTKFIFTIRVKSFEECIFHNDRLIYSSVNRSVNGNEKANKQTRAGIGGYTAYNEGKTKLLRHQSIAYNMTKLYWFEPVSITMVYSDNFQQFLPIKKIRSHTYKIELPDGNYNYYSYSNGICSRVEVFNSLYNMQMILKESK